MSTKLKPKTVKVTTPLTIEKALDAKVTDAAKKVGLSKQAVMRLSMERGLDILLAQLLQSPAA